MAVLVISALIAPARTAPRVALVSGNAAYAHVPALDNSAHDANDMAAALRDLGFQVTLGVDRDRQDMQAPVADFAKAAQGADVALDDDLAAMSRGSGLKIVLLDACGDNPLRIPGGGTGLARVSGPADFLIGYATQPGAVAFDGTGRNGTFTAVLLNHIRTPAQDIGDVMIAVRRDVVAQTGGQQTPWDASGLTQQFRFDDGPPGIPPETLFYQVALRAGDPALLRLYLQRYPDGAHVTDVLARYADQAMTDCRPAPRALAQLLPGVAADDGSLLRALTQKAGDWTPGTLMALQQRLGPIGLYDTAVDGKPGPALARALDGWRMAASTRRPGRARPRTAGPCLTGPDWPAGFRSGARSGSASC